MKIKIYFVFTGVTFNYVYKTFKVPCENSKSFFCFFNNKEDCCISCSI